MRAQGPPDCIDPSSEWLHVRESREAPLHAVQKRLQKEPTGIPLRTQKKLSELAEREEREAIQELIIRGRARTG